MKRIFLTILTTLFIIPFVFGQEKKEMIELTTQELTELYKDVRYNNQSVHDPSVVWDEKSGSYYLYGSHYIGAKSKDLRNWSLVTNYYNTSYDKAFKSNPSHKVNRKLPNSTAISEITLGSFDAAAFCATYSSIKVDDRAPVSEADWVRGDQWAPDVIYNPNTGKYCYYVSLNGDYWASVIVLMTSSNIEGPYKYEGPVVFGGFDGQTRTGKSVDYKKTDLELVLGPQSSLPSRYKTNKWGSFYPNCIDPCVFFDEEGELWMSYGSWSGGIFILKLDKNTGLRDYTYTYSGTGSTPDANATSDAYFGKKIAGGYYVSGEGSYIQHIGDYYYLFMSYGFFSPEGGYEMRLFRSEKPDGPYKDAAGVSAVYNSYQLNYGKNAATNRGVKLIGAMNNWGLMKVGECAQGHNSACVDGKGRNILVCHTKFNNGTAGHQLRSYQMYLNKLGWLCCAPFQFAGETTTDNDIANSQPYSASNIEGDYHFIMHPYKLAHDKFEESTPSAIHLSADGTVTGDYTGTWKYTDEGKSYFQITLKKVGTSSSFTYNGVVVEQTLEGTSAKVLCFTALCTASGAQQGVPCWGYKLQPQSAIAYNYKKYSGQYLKAANFSNITKNVNVLFDPDENVTLTWESSQPEIFSNTGKYNPIDESVVFTMTAKLECGNYFWKNDYRARASMKTSISGDQTTGLVAYYNFDDDPTYNFDDNQKDMFTYGRVGSKAVKPALEVDYSRFGKVLHQYYGGSDASNSYSRIPNPLKGRSDIEGFTVSLWVKRLDSADNLGALWGFYSNTTTNAKGGRLFYTANSYLGFNDNQGNWFDVNNPDKKKLSAITNDEWRLVTVTFSVTNGYMLYVDGTKYLSANMVYSGSTPAAKDFDMSLVMNFVRESSYFYLGMGSFWGSVESCMDDLMIYDRELSAEDVKGLSVMLNRVNSFNDGTYTGISDIISDEQECGLSNGAKSGIYDMLGRKVERPGKGLYIVDGKKVLFK